MYLLPFQEYTVPFQNLVPETSYSFRVIAYNEFGISPPTNTLEEVGCRSWLVRGGGGSSYTSSLLLGLWLYIIQRKKSRQIFFFVHKSSNINLINTKRWPHYVFAKDPFLLFEPNPNQYRIRNTILIHYWDLRRLI